MSDISDADRQDTSAAAGPACVFQVHEIRNGMYVVHEGQLVVNNHYHGTRVARRTAGGAVGTECPYPGLAAFGPEQAQWFYGRDRLVDQVLQRIDETLDAGRPVMVVAPSGAGKSSLLRAGVLPRIGAGDLPARGSVRWPHLWLTPTARPLDALAAGLAAFLHTDTESVRGILNTAPDQLITQLRARLSDTDTGPAGRLIVVVDQFEELFSLCPQHNRSAFVALLGRLVTAGPDGATPVALVLCGLRSDFYTPCATFPVLREALQHNQVFVGAMSSDELSDVILCPADDVGLQVEPGLVDLLLRDLAPAPPATGDSGSDNGSDNGDPRHQAGYEPGRLPLLAHALRTMWQHCDGRTLTVAGYRAGGGIRSAIATTAERIHHGLDPDVREAVRPVFLRLVRIGDTNDGFDDTRRRVAHADLIRTTADPADKVVRAYIQARLLTVAQDTVEITHEALLRAWPRLRAWIDTDRAGNRLRQDIEDTATEWEIRGRDGDLLWRGSRLDTAVDRAKAHPTQLTATARAFLDASTHADRRTRRLRLTAIATLALVTVLAVVAAVVALVETKIIAQQRDLAVDREIIAEADAVRVRDTSAAARLDDMAYQRHPTDDLRTQLIADASTPLSTVLTGHKAVRSVAFSPDRRTLASASDDHTIRLWNVTDPTHASPLGPPLTGNTGNVNAVEFSPDGRTVVSGGADGTLRMWNVADPARPTSDGQPMTTGGHAVDSVAFAPDGRTLASGDADGTIRFWDVTDPIHARPLGQPRSGQAGKVSSVAFSPDDRTLAISGADDTIRLWKVSDPAHASPLGRPLAGHGDSVDSVAFSPDGRVLASGSDDDTIRLWNVSNPVHAGPLGSPLESTDNVRSVVFSADGGTLASGSDDGTIRLWNVTDPADAGPLGQPLVGHANSVNSVAFSPDGRTLASGGDDATIRLWNVSGSYLIGHTDSVDSVAFSPDGRILASGGDDGTIRLWNVTNPTDAGSLGQPLTDHFGSGLSVAFRPDGRILASGGDDGTIRLWDVSNPSRPALIRDVVTRAGNAVDSLVFSRDGKTLASGGDDGVITLWNVANAASPTRVGQPLVGHASSVWSVAFSPDDRTLASGSQDSTIRLWNVADPAHATQSGSPLARHTDSVNSVTFGPDGGILASGSDDGTIQLWNVIEPGHATPLGQPLSGHTDSVESVVFGRDGRTLFSGSDDGTIRLWNVAHPVDSFSLGQPLSGHTNSVASMAFSPDGGTLASGSDDNTIRLWDTDISQDIQRICKNTSDLTKAEWQTYIPDVTYSPRC